jgi:hypothetical protein
VSCSFVKFPLRFGGKFGFARRAFIVGKEIQFCGLEFLNVSNNSLFQEIDLVCFSISSACCLVLLSDRKSVHSLLTSMLFEYQYFVISILPGSFGSTCTFKVSFQTHQVIILSHSNLSGCQLSGTNSFALSISCFKTFGLSLNLVSILTFLNSGNPQVIFFKSSNSAFRLG